MQDTNMNPMQALQKVMDSFYRIWTLPSIYTATELRIPDLLKDGPKTAAELAMECEAHEDSLYRLLRNLAGVGYFEEVEGKKFINSSLSDTLRSDVPYSLREAVIFVTQEYSWRSFGHVLHTVKTGKPAFDDLYGKPYFDYIAEHPEKSENFNQVMVTLTTMANPAILASYDFSEFNTVVDIGGGYGILMSALLKQTPQLKGILFDQEHVVVGAKEHLESQGVAERCEVVGGSFFESVPSGGDAYVMKYILHDWGNEQALSILQTCRRAMGKDAKLLLIEQVIPEENPPVNVLYMDMHMMTFFTGRERSKEDFRVLLEKAGFELNRVIPTGTEYFVIEALPV